MPYWRLFYHVVWATRNREPLIGDALAPALQQQIARTACELGAVVYAVGGIENHIHLVVSVPPRIALSEFIGKVKGNSSHFVNHELVTDGTFAWQSDYGLISLHGKQLDGVVSYVKGQRRHHADRTAIAVLERVTQEGDATG